ncbi:4-(cytidine 5'-diphospho)-2-C-methyl-D-erythritol kinase [Lichenicola cladoniae]|uniref:4-diphosphocytidyl-2-C-methyl-D-erythritol kinase n=1 Tax=Lichenicola cladoniae TaxID=1484109 RepID=A0A6M8HRM2_9PROT|nr:4-(cytidine 5'-diphospho)-2-C-methyl-D-erythritol kinase [Lichenicola cladoniae]NPD65860.1 4-(cytidine 5'-diphospho)-2-C-methyl-D-erythritol kinase [Acetobacteraceae bacterium]QKE91139.1 4-(cytidine 5'-diphospho)-2-C-methyl-D-erythritol kinase [Lichenicola cladoniae]
MTGQERPLLERAHAKINLYLHVVGRRDDGYHRLDSLAVFAGAHDVLTAEPAQALSLGLTGPFAAGLRDEDTAANLVMRAARLLQAEAGHGAGAAIRLEKTLPIASGIGGGSADAAAALRLLRRLWNADGVDEARLAGLAATLGADVPVCLPQRAARMGGIGEELRPAPVLPDCFMVLVNCGVAVSTPAVFRARAPGFRAPADLPAGWTDLGAMADDLTRLANDLEPAAMALCPPIVEVLAAIVAQSGCRLARMSGSGATCFGLFTAEHEALDAARALARPGWWVWGGPLAGT